MTDDPNAPERLLDSAGDAELRGLLEAGRDELPSAEQLASLAARLGPVLGPGGSGGGGGQPGAVAKTGGVGATLAKVFGTAALAMIMAGGVTHFAGSGARAPSVIGSPAASVAVTTAAPVPAAAVESPPPAPSVLARPPAARTVTSGPSSPDDPDAEVALLQRAQGSLETDPAQTLALCAEHARRFPRGLMTQEREVLAIEALVHTGRTDEARARADRFAASYPTSTHLRRIRAVVGEGP